MGMKQPIQLPIQFAAGICVGISILFTPVAAQAAEQITIMVGPLNRSISVSELETLAEEGIAKGDLATALKISKQTPESAGKLLTQEIPFDLVQADRLLTSPIGESLLGQIGRVMAPRSSNSAGDIAMRSAILLSLADDGKMTVLEVLRRYPTNARLNLSELREVQDQLKDLPRLLQGGFGG